MSHGAFVYITDETRRVLITQRRDPNPDHGGADLMLPGGGQEPGEILRETAVREFSEEVGISLCPSNLRLDSQWFSRKGGMPVNLYQAIAPLKSDEQFHLSEEEVRDAYFADPETLFQSKKVLPAQRRMIAVTYKRFNIFSPSRPRVHEDWLSGPMVWEEIEELTRKS